MNIPLSASDPVPTAKCPVFSLNDMFGCLVILFGSNNNMEITFSTDIYFGYKYIESSFISK